MKKIFLIICCWLLVAGSFAQTVSSKLAAAFRQFENDPQLKHAVSSLHVIDSKTGKVVFSKNAQIGLVPASTQKIITAATAFELLGKDYRYKTNIIFKNEDENRVLILIIGSGDPTLGSWRYHSTKDSIVLNRWVDVIKSTKKNRALSGIRLYDMTTGDLSSVPDGYIWEDIGNYYGSGTTKLNWRENQYSISFKSWEVGYPAEIIEISPLQNHLKFTCLVRSGNAGSGDNAYIYCPPFSKEAVIHGTIPPNQKKFTISGSMPDPAFSLGIELRNKLLRENIKIDSFIYTSRTIEINDGPVPPWEFIENGTHFSPTLDSIIYWFLQKSINLYGEALIKTIANREKEFFSTDTGINIVKKFWKAKGIDDDELNIGDGSGLSPQNRVTTHAQVEILKYAKKQSWFSYFYDALPEYNNMKMKSGTIKGVKGYSGYHKSRSGQEYIFSFVVNNYNGSPSSLVNKMYRVLNVLK